MLKRYALSRLLTSSPALSFRFSVIEAVAGPGLDILIVFPELYIRPKNLLGRYDFP